MNNTFAFLTQVFDAVPFAKVDDFDVGQGAKPPGWEELVQILKWVAWICFGICVGAVMWAGAMMGMSARRGEGGEHAGRLGWTLAGAIIIGSASAIVGKVA